MTTCWYRDCSSVRRYPSCTYVFFALPKDPVRRAQWVERCGHRPDSLPANATRHLCERHFDEAHLRRQFYRTTLASFAVPLQWDSNAKPAEMESSSSSNSRCTKRQWQIAAEEKADYATSEDKIEEPAGDYAVEQLYISNDNDDASTLHEVEIVETLLDTDSVDADDVDENSHDHDQQNGGSDMAAGLQINICGDDDRLDGSEEYSVMEEDAEEHLLQSQQQPAPLQSEDHHGEADVQTPTDCDTTTTITPEGDDETSNSNRIAQSTSVPVSLFRSLPEAVKRRQQKVLMRLQMQKNKQRMRNVQQHRQQQQQRAARRQKLRAAPETKKKAQHAPSVALVQPPPGDPEDTYFALSLVGLLQRLRPQQRAMAKLNIVRYLTEMAFTDAATL